jgi:hypothetical protein
VLSVEVFLGSKCADFWVEKLIFDRSGDQFLDYKICLIFVIKREEISCVTTRI